LELGTKTDGAWLGLEDLAGLDNFSGAFELHGGGVNDIAVAVATNKKRLLWVLDGVVNLPV
jgi:hypothetical protein